MRPDGCIPKATPHGSNKHANIDVRLGAGPDPESPRESESAVPVLVV